MSQFTLELFRELEVRFGAGADVAFHEQGYLLLASPENRSILADNVALVATYWISYQKISTGERAAQAFSLDRAAYQVLSLIAPFLRGNARALLDRLSRDYL